MKTLTYYMEANEALDWALETMTGENSVLCKQTKERNTHHD